MGALCSEGGWADASVPPRAPLGSGVTASRCVHCSPWEVALVHGLACPVGQLDYDARE